jgi:circadian clock protein KaiB
MDPTADAGPDETGGSATTATQQFERALTTGLPVVRYELELYVAGAAPRSLRAIAIIRKLCDERLPGRYDLQVIDIYQEPALAEREGILAVPALIRRQPLPVLTLVGDMSNLGHVMSCLGLPPGRAGEDAG